MVMVTVRVRVISRVITPTKNGIKCTAIFVVFSLSQSYKVRIRVRVRVRKN